MGGNRAVILFLGPALVAIGVFFFLPVLAAFVLSFTDFDIYALGSFAFARFVGFKNYAQLLSDPLFWKAFRNTLEFLLIGGPLSIGVSLAAALMIQSKLVRWKGFFRTAFSRRSSRRSSRSPLSGGSSTIRGSVSSITSCRSSGSPASTGSAISTGRCPRSY
jgi:hypothetical protein